ncbi:unnamed protein product, partial [Prorocentrum cordatum]
VQSLDYACNAAADSSKAMLLGRMQDLFKTVKLHFKALSDKIVAQGFNISLVDYLESLSSQGSSLPTGGHRAALAAAIQVPTAKTMCRDFRWFVDKCAPLFQMANDALEAGMAWDSDPTFVGAGMLSGSMTCMQSLLGSQDTESMAKTLRSLQSVLPAKHMAPHSCATASINAVLAQDCLAKSAERPAGGPEPKRRKGGGKQQAAAAAAPA